MKITSDWLAEKGACSEGKVWFEAQKETDVVKVLEKLMEENQLDWANWTIVRVMSYKQYVGYAVYAAEQVIDLYEKKHPDDKRPRQAIEVAKACIKDPSNKNKVAAGAAAHAAGAAGAAAYAADAAADAAAYAAYAAHAATYAAHAAAYAADAADAAGAAMKKKILNYGIKLLKEEK